MSNYMVSGWSGRVRKESEAMQVIYPRCAGLDVHPDSVTSCVMLTADDGSVEKQGKTFGTFTSELLLLGDWLKTYGVTHVAMESTGAYWKPVWNVLEEQFQLLLANAQHLKTVPGRKTDVSDSEWIADLHRHGLLRASFVPLRPQRELRELVRHRAGMVQRIGQLKNELQEVLESANIKLARVASDISGVSATEMLEGLLGGQARPEQLAELARGRLREKKTQLVQALSGRLESHHRLIITQLLADVAWCEEQVEEVSQEIAQRLQGEAEVMERLDGIPGVNRRIAEVIIAEVGTDMSRFPTDKHLVSWSGVCPGNNQSGGRRRSARIRPGNRSLKGVIIEAAHAAARKKGSYLKAKYHRLAGRRGKKRAKVAVARSILQSAYHMMNRGTAYQDLGEDYYERRNPEQLVRRLTQRIQKLGYTVVVEQKKAA
jgi:transposase